MAYNLLSEPIRKYIRDKGWEQLRPIQNAAITKIMTSDNNFILVSRTASGKTEAAFLPLLSKINFNESGVQILYISPLIALINDQFYRIEELCKNLEIPVTKWHGEANRTIKNNLLKAPAGIVLITPESLEAMFVNKPYNVKQLFANLKYVVIDEIHSFIGTDRGTQLKSILSRLQNVNKCSFSIVGLSATMSEANKFNEVKEFTGNPENTTILIDRTAKEINTAFRYFKSDKQELPLALLKDLYLETKDDKVLIFPNSRGSVEEVAVKLKKISDRVQGHSNYFSHHSSVDREVREYIEFFAKNNERENFCISCTSTLELGIDIGTVDEVVQIDATHSIASLIQRVGRSGRKDGKNSSLFLYATDQWSLLQSVGCWLLYKEGFIEPPDNNEKPYDILVHQALSITKGYSGIQLNDLLQQLKTNTAFKHIEVSEINEIIQHLIEIDFLEKLQHEVIIGVEGEKIVNSRDFYSVFKTEENFKVVHSGNTIGAIPLSLQIIEDENILLAAKIWKITYVDHKAKKIEVKPTNDGKKPIFFGGGSIIHPKIRQKMFEVLYSDTKYDFLDEAGSIEIEIMRKDFSVFDVKNTESDRPLLNGKKNIEFYTFAGTKINRTIGLLLSIAGINSIIDENSSSIIVNIDGQDFENKMNHLLIPQANIDNHLALLLDSNPTLLNFSKWGAYLPQQYKVQLLKNTYYDFKDTEKMMDRLNIVANK